MTVSGAMSAAVSVLNSSAYAVDVAANNIVNANTAGYESGTVRNKTRVTTQARLTGYAPGSVQAVLVDGGNVDVGTEFVRIIIAQRAYEGGVGILKTTDRMMQELVNIKA